MQDFAGAWSHSPLVPAFMEAEAEPGLDSKIQSSQGYRVRNNLKDTGTNKQTLTAFLRIMETVS